MSPRRRRFAALAASLGLLGCAAVMVVFALRQNVVFFYTPSQVFAEEAPRHASFRVGGLVQHGSISRDSGGLTVRFIVTDTARSVPVAYTGLLPDLFREGKGVVAQGRLGTDGVFRATEVLAKHDENYMPREAAHAVERARAERTVFRPD
jgi:cytochrome c-type biogenesis protein CcmE